MIKSLQDKTYADSHQRHKNGERPNHQKYFAYYGFIFLLPEGLLFSHSVPPLICGGKVKACGSLVY